MCSIARANTWCSDLKPTQTAAVIGTQAEQHRTQRLHHSIWSMLAFQRSWEQFLYSQRSQQILSTTKNTLFVELPSKTTHFSVRLSDVPIGIIWTCQFLITIEKRTNITALWFADTEAAIIIIFTMTMCQMTKAITHGGDIFQAGFVLNTFTQNTSIMWRKSDWTLFFWMEVNLSELKSINHLLCDIFKQTM